MLVASELKGELARIYPPRECCRRAELAGLTYGDAAVPATSARRVELRTLDHSTARIAVHLAADLGVLLAEPGMRATRALPRRSAGGRRGLRVVLDRGPLVDWSWSSAADCDRRAFLRGVTLGAGSLSFSPGGPHLEYVFRDVQRAEELRRRLRDSDVRAAVLPRRGRSVVYVKGGEELVTLLRVAGASRALLDFEATRVGREVQNQLNRMLNAEQANLRRTVTAAGRQLAAIERLDHAGRLTAISQRLREAATARRLHPEADLDAVAAALGISRSATNHRLRRLVELAEELDEVRERTGADAARRW